MKSEYVFAMEDQVEAAILTVAEFTQAIASLSDKLDDCANTVVNKVSAQVGGNDEKWSNRLTELDTRVQNIPSLIGSHFETLGSPLHELIRNKQSGDAEASGLVDIRMELQRLTAANDSRQRAVADAEKADARTKEVVRAVAAGLRGVESYFRSKAGPLNGPLNGNTIQDEVKALMMTDLYNIGVEEIRPRKGMPFDRKRHEIVSGTPGDIIEKTIVPGYKLGNEVLVLAQVECARRGGEQ